MRYAALILILLAGSTNAEETVEDEADEEWEEVANWSCQAGSLWLSNSPILIVATASENHGTALGFVYVAGTRKISDYYVEGFNRRWNFGFSEGESEHSQYSFVIEPDGSAYYYDFSSADDGDVIQPSQTYVCRETEEDETEYAPENERRVADSPEMDAYRFAIAQKIRRNWSMPASAGPDTVCVARVRQIPGGEIVSVNILSCNGDEAVKRSVEAAIHRSSPLPEPSNPDLFRADLELNLRPD